MQQSIGKTNFDETIEVLEKAKHEILSLKNQINHLKYKADAYDNISSILRLIPFPNRQGMGEDIGWLIDQHISDMKENENA